MEKASSLLLKMLVSDDMARLGTVVIDEAHIISEPKRGNVLELLISKIKYFDKDKTIQIIAMSATLADVNLMANWLGATLYVSEYRPVPLTEYYTYDSLLYNINDPTKSLKKYNSKDPIVELCQEVVNAKGSVLVFCESKDRCANCAIVVAKGLNETSVDDQDVIESRNGILRQLEGTPCGLDDRLKMTICKGVAYHNAGLMHEERDIIEKAYRSGVINILVVRVNTCRIDGVRPHQHWLLALICLLEE